MRKDFKPLRLVGSLHNFQGPFSPSLRLLYQLTRVAPIGPDLSQSGKLASQIRQYQLGSVSVLHIRRMNHATQNQAQRIHNDVALAALYFLARIVAAGPPFSVVFTLWLSTIAALGLFLRPSSRLMRSRSTYGFSPKSRRLSTACS